MYKLRDKMRGGGVSMFINNRLNFHDIIFNLQNIDLLAVEIGKEWLNNKRNVTILTDNIIALLISRPSYLIRN